MSTTLKQLDIVVYTYNIDTDSLKDQMYTDLLYNNNATEQEVKDFIVAKHKVIVASSIINLSIER